MPRLLRTYDPVGMYKFCMAIWPFAFILLPFLNLIAQRGVGETPNPKVAAMVWVGIAVVLTMSRIACLAFSYVTNVVIFVPLLTQVLFSGLA